MQSRLRISVPAAAGPAPAGSASQPSPALRVSGHVAHSARPTLRPPRPGPPAPPSARGPVPRWPRPVGSATRRLRARGGSDPPGPRNSLNTSLKVTTSMKPISSHKAAVFTAVSYSLRDLPPEHLHAAIPSMTRKKIFPPSRAGMGSRFITARFTASMAPK